MKFEFEYPTILKDVVVIGQPYGNYTKTGNFSSFGINIEIPKLNLHKTIKSSDEGTFVVKVNNALSLWGEKYKRHLDNQTKIQRSNNVEQKNAELQLERQALENILTHTLNVNDAINWRSIKESKIFRNKLSKYITLGKLPIFIKCDRNKKPIRFISEELPKPPKMAEHLSGYSFFAKAFNKKKIKTEFVSLQDAYEIELKKAISTNESRTEFLKKLLNEYDGCVKKYETEKQIHAEKIKLQHEKVEDFKARYKAKNKEAVQEYCDLVLENSDYPNLIPKDWELQYSNENNTVIVNYSLPAPQNMPAVEKYTFIKSKNEVTEKLYSGAMLKKQYDDLIYQLAIRTLHELFEADVAGAIDAVCLNGIVTMVNDATGKIESKTIISVLASKDEFIGFDLSKVDPKKTFKHLKGVSAATLVQVSAVPPVMYLDRVDKRFVDNLDTAVNIDTSTNLAAMHWEDFEHLVREIFEKEFLSTGGEVKVTQASFDGGVDAIAFDPDPIRGGKIVIQAKRYTNTVGVAAVRDLYGTVMNEGATKGILVTTSNFGSDSYSFAKDKPLTLLNGSNLLSLIEKHGQKARIDIEEAKVILQTSG